MVPSDPMILFSYINMKLRDQYPSLDELCRAEDIDHAWLISTLGAVGFEYSEEHNKFW
jgi:hypothetical protein